MDQPNSNLHREAFIFTKQAGQGRSRIFLTEEEYFTAPAKPYTPGIRDAVVLSLGNWLIKVGHNLKTRSVYARLSEKQA
jgi:hypothetical protein